MVKLIEGSSTLIVTQDELQLILQEVKDNKDITNKEELLVSFFESNTVDLNNGEILISIPNINPFTANINNFKKIKISVRKKSPFKITNKKEYNEIVLVKNLDITEGLFLKNEINKQVEESDKQVEESEGTAPPMSSSSSSVYSTVSSDPQPEHEPESEPIEEEEDF